MRQRIHPGWFKLPPPVRPPADGKLPPADTPKTPLIARMNVTQEHCYVIDPDRLRLGRAWIGAEPVLITEIYGSKLTLVRNPSLAEPHSKDEPVRSAERGRD